jgi:glucokinase
MILAGDVGGTRCRLALHEGDRAHAERVLATRDFTQFGEAMARFLADAGRPAVSAAAIAVAGPVLDGRVRMTNLGWVLDEREISRALGGCPVRLLNDLEAAAYGVLGLPAEDFRVLAEGTPVARGNVALIGAGTGLGEALLAWHGTEPVAIASEGGHADFAPADATEVALLEWLGRTRAHVSFEHVASGPGIVRVYEFLRNTGRADEPPALRDRLAATHEPSMVITQAGSSGEFPICERAVEIFVRAYGAEAGNLALKGMTLGGVYVTGGIAPRVLDGRWGEAFVRAFVAKGRYEELMRRIPVRVVLCEKASLAGAVAVGRRALRDRARGLTTTPPGTPSTRRRARPSPR